MCLKMKKTNKKVVEFKTIRFYVMYNCSNCGAGNTICLGDYCKPEYWNGKRVDECSECYHPSSIRIQAV